MVATGSKSGPQAHCRRASCSALEREGDAIAEVNRTLVPAAYFDALLADLDKAEPAPRLEEAVRAARSRSWIRAC